MATHEPMSLQDFLDKLSWSQAELARQSGLSINVVRKAVNGESISHRSAKAIADALATATGNRVFAGEIRGLSIQ